MSRTAITLKFKVLWFPNEGRYGAVKLQTDININCCVPLCNQRGTVDANGKRVGFFNFSKDPNPRAQWLHAQKIRRDVRTKFIHRLVILQTMYGQKKNFSTFSYKLVQISPTMILVNSGAFLSISSWFCELTELIFVMIPYISSTGYPPKTQGIMGHVQVANSTRIEDRLPL